MLTAFDGLPSFVLFMIIRKSKKESSALCANLEIASPLKEPVVKGKTIGKR